VVEHPDWASLIHDASRPASSQVGERTSQLAEALPDDARISLLEALDEMADDETLLVSAHASFGNEPAYYLVTNRDLRYGKPVKGGLLKRGRYRRKFFLMKP
jgi:hypothetical protein